MNHIQWHKLFIGHVMSNESYAMDDEEPSNSCFTLDFTHESLHRTPPCKIGILFRSFPLNDNELIPLWIVHWTTIPNQWTSRNLGKPALSGWTCKKKYISSLAIFKSKSFIGPFTSKFSSVFLARNGEVQGSGISHQLAITLRSAVLYQN